MPPRKARSRRKKVVGAMNRVQDPATSVYLPLCTERREIRLLSLSPGQFQDEIHGSLSKFSLNECPPYEALSYVWGAGGSSRHIFIGGVAKLVTQNLEVALRHLRHVSQIRVLWIDAICINQRDIPERNTQVIHMGDVYRSAFRVMAWLGEEDEDSNLAYDALEALPKYEQSHWDFSNSPASKTTFLEAKYTTAIERLFQRAWWQRIWTVQESILGPTLYFICGNREISADILCALTQDYYKHLSSCCYYFVKRQLGRNLTKPMALLDDLRIFRRNKDSHDLLHLLIKFRHRICMDPRDKVYGLLGLSSAEVKKKILPDYSMPFSLVYEQVVLEIIEKSHSLEVFSQVCRRSLDGVELATINLPSWVPDWTLQMNEFGLTSLRIRQSRNFFYKASSGSFALVRHVKHGRIALKGILLSVIGALGTPNRSHISKSICNNWRDLTRVEALPNRLYDKKTLTTYYDAYWQTLCCSILLSRTSLQGAGRVIRIGSNPSHRSLYNAWWTWTSEFDSDEDKLDLVSSEYTGLEIWAFAIFVDVSTNMRRLFISSDEEWLGLAPMNAIAGDVIALLEGGSVPYILHRSEKQPGAYELIGDAYVHGVMDGESWNPDLLQEIVLV